MPFKSIRLSESTNTNFGEIILHSATYGSTRIPCFTKQNLEKTEQNQLDMFQLGAKFGLSQEIIKKALCSTEKEAEEKLNVLVEIDISHQTVESELDKLQIAGGLPFGDWFKEIAPTEKINHLTENGYYVIVQLLPIK